jgi:hypothetical protein
MFCWREQTDPQVMRQGFTGHVIRKNDQEQEIMLYVRADKFCILSWWGVQISLPEFIKYFNRAIDLWSLCTWPEKPFSLNQVACLGLLSTKRVHTNKQRRIPIQIPQRQFLGEKIKKITFMRFDVPTTDAFHTGNGLSFCYNFSPLCDGDPYRGEFTLGIPVGHKPLKMIIDLHCRIRQVDLKTNERLKLRDILSKHLP